MRGGVLRSPEAPGGWKQRWGVPCKAGVQGAQGLGGGSGSAGRLQQLLGEKG